MHLNRFRGQRPIAGVFLILVGQVAMATAAGAQMQVRVEPVLLAPIAERLPLSGTVISPRNSDVAPQESGLVLRLPVEVGDRVDEGDVLLDLDAELTRLQLRGLQARQEEARLLYADAGRLADEGRRLIGERNISQSEHESRLAAEAAAEQRVAQLESEVAVQRLRLERSTLRAPFAGVIALKLTEVGQWLQAGTPAVRLVQLDPIRIQARVPERYFADVGAGSPVRIEFDARPGEPVDARIDMVVPVSDTDTRSYLARVDIPNPDLRLAPGMSARVDFLLGPENARPVLQVPADAIVRRAGGDTVVWVVRDGTARPMGVTLGRRNDRRVEIWTPVADEAGLAEGDLVVTLGNEALREGQNVTAVRD